MARFCQNFQIKRFELLFFGRGYCLVDIGNVNDFTVCFVDTEPTVEIQKSTSGGSGFLRSLVDISSLHV